MTIRTGRGCESAASMKRRSTTHSVEVIYRVYDPTFDAALREFASAYKAKRGGSGFDLQTRKRDIFFWFGKERLARNFMDHLKMRFRVRAKIVPGKH